jgi:hypothetical protein
MWRLSMPSGYVESAAVISGWPAKIIDQVLSRHLPQYFAGVRQEDLAELKAAHQQIGRARRAYEAGVGSAVGTSEPAGSEPSEGLSHGDWFDTATVADMLRMGQRAVCKRAVVWETEGLARRHGRVWLIDPIAVEIVRNQPGRRAAA